MVSYLQTFRENSVAVIFLQPMTQNSVGTLLFLKIEIVLYSSVQKSQERAKKFGQQICLQYDQAKHFNI